MNYKALLSALLPTQNFLLLKFEQTKEQYQFISHFSLG